MPVGFSSPARNLFLLGSSGAQVVTNFFKTIDQSAGTDGVYLPNEIKYNYVDQKFVLAGSASDSNSKGFGWFEKRDDAGTADWDVRIEAGVGVNTTLNAMELDSNNNLIVVGKTADIPWIAKYSNSGVLDWQSTTNSGDVEYYDIASDSNGQYYACGHTIATGSLFDSDAFVEKFDANGNPGWGKSARILGGDVKLEAIACNSRGEVVAGGRVEDENRIKAYLVKIDTNTGDVLWDRTIESHREDSGGNPEDLSVEDVYVDSNDQIYVVGVIAVRNPSTPARRSYIIKYTPEGNIVWQKETEDDVLYYQVKSDGETEQTVVFGVYDDSNTNDEGGVLSKYSKNGSLVWRRTLFSSFNNSDTFGASRRKVNLDADPSFYYLLYTDGPYSTLNGTPETYTYGKVSSSGNGLGAFQYEEGTGETIDYEILNLNDKIGRLFDGSVRQDTSDLITYPFNANKILFDDLATQVSNKKRQMDSAGNFEYSGSPAIRPADFQELNLLGDTGIVAATGTNYTAQISGTQFNASNPKEHAFDGNLSNWTTALNGTSLTWTPSGGLAVSSSLRLYAAREAATDNITVTFTDTSTFNSFTADNTFKWYDITGAAGKTIDNINWTHNNTFSRIAAIEVDGVILVDPRGAWEDQSGNDTDAVVYGVTHNATGYWEFDGTDDYIDITSIDPIADTSAVTMEAWVYADTLTNLYQVVGTWERQTQHWQLTYSGDTNYNLGLAVSGTGDSVGTTSAPATGSWQHIVATWNGGSLTTLSDWAIYVDGVKQTIQFTGSTGTAGNDSYIGTRQGFAASNFFDGKIGEVRYYSRALTAAQAFQNYNATKSQYGLGAASTDPGLTSTRTP